MARRAAVVGRSLSPGAPRDEHPELARAGSVMLVQPGAFLHYRCIEQLRLSALNCSSKRVALGIKTRCKRSADTGLSGLECDCYRAARKCSRVGEKR